jgi:outer membrane protein TolC
MTKTKSTKFKSAIVLPVVASIGFVSSVAAQDAQQAGEEKKPTVVVEEAQKPGGEKKPPAVVYVKFIDLLPTALASDDNVKNAQLNVSASSESAIAARSGWYPKVDLTLNSARQQDVKVNAANDAYNPTEAKIKITQPLVDFGETSADVATAELGVSQAEIALNGAVNQSIMQAAQAYTGLKRAFAQYKIAVESELKLKKQTGLQDYRVQRGAAVGTDVLQAKNALAGATTARVSAQGALESAKINFRSKFGEVPDNIDSLLPIQVPRMLVPESLDAFRTAVMRDGDSMKQASVAFERSQVTAEKAYASNFLPEVNFTWETNYKGDSGGTLGGKTEHIAKVEMTWPIELFGTQFNSYRAAKIRGESAGITYAKAKRDLEDRITTTWIGYQNTVQRVSYVSNQVEIARQFARLAQMEVQQGRGNMMLVVNAQTAVVNAQKDLENVNTDLAVQIYSMLSQMGALSVGALQDADKAEAEARAKAIEEYKAKVKEAQEEMKKAEEDAKQPPKGS